MNDEDLLPFFYVNCKYKCEIILILYIFDEKQKVPWLRFEFIFY